MFRSILHLSPLWSLLAALTVTVSGRILKEHMNDQDQWTKLYHYLDKLFADVHTEIAELRVELNDKVDQANTALDGLAKASEADELERLAMNQQLDRHERWHHQAADKLGLQLDH